jgi:hypothetical protein
MKNLEQKIERAIAELKDSDEYGWSNVIETLEECASELEGWRESALASFQGVRYRRVDLDADQ